MFTILASLVGFLSSLLPDIMKYAQDRQDKAHELEIMKLQIEREKLGLQARSEEIQIQADVTALTSAYSMQDTSKVKWIAAINDLMRPLITTLIVMDFVTVTWMQYNLLVATGAIDSLGIISDILWSADDRHLFAMVMSYWFGRLLKKSLN